MTNPWDTKAPAFSDRSLRAEWGGYPLRPLHQSRGAVYVQIRLLNYIVPVLTEFLLPLQILRRRGGSCTTAAVLAVMGPEHSDT